MCQFGQTRNGFLATHFNFLNGTATSSATGGYVAVPERFSQNEEPASRTNEQARNKRSFVPNIVKRQTVKSCKIVTCNQVFLVIFLKVFMNLIVFSSYAKPFDLVLCAFIYCVGEGTSSLLDVHFWPIRRIPFPSKNEGDTVYGEEMDGKLFVSRQSWQFLFLNIMVKVLLLLCALT